MNAVDGGAALGLKRSSGRTHMSISRVYKGSKHACNRKWQQQLAPRAAAEAVVDVGLMGCNK
jgi:hypothetical protein